MPRDLYDLFGVPPEPEPIPLPDGFESAGQTDPECPAWAFAEDDSEETEPMVDGRVWLDELNPEQRTAAVARGNICVIAGAGTGKTKTLIAAIKDRIVGDRVPANTIMVVTFTRKAAGEMRERLISAGCAVPRYLGTFHSVCIRLMRDYPYIVSSRQEGFQFLDDSAIKVMIRDFLIPSIPESDFKEIETLYNRPKNKALKFSEVATEFRNIISALKSERITPEDVENDTLDYGNMPYHLASLIDDSPGAWLMVQQCYRQYEDMLHQKNALDYDDIINIPLRALETSTRLRQKVQDRIRTVLVDEYQDCSLNQKQLAEIIAGDGGSLFVVGDDGQSIYGWRGAHVDFIRRRAEAPGVETVNLERNYRSTNGILNIGRIMLSYDPQALDKVLVADGPNASDTSVPVAYHHATGFHEFEFIADDVRNRLAAGAACHSIAVLVRSRWIGHMVMNALIRNHIPAKMEDGSMWDKKEIRFLVAAALLALDGDAPANIFRLHDLLSSGVMPTGVGESGLKSLRAAAERFGVRRALSDLALRNKKVSVILSAIQTIGEKSQDNMSAKAVIERLFVDTGLKTALLNKASDLDMKIKSAERARVGKLQDERSQIKHRLLDIDNLIAVAASVESLEELVSTAIMGRDCRADENAVLVSTIHGAKGLEWETVYLPGFSDQNMKIWLTMLTQNLGISGGVDVAQMEEFGETCRLAYVATTRAKKNLIFSWSDVYRKDGPWNRKCPLLEGIPKTALTVRKVMPVSRYSSD